jgi:hypothetical protein
LSLQGRAVSCARVYNGLVKMYAKPSEPTLRAPRLACHERLCTNT